MKERKKLEFCSQFGENESIPKPVVCLCELLQALKWQLNLGGGEQRGEAGPVGDEQDVSPKAGGEQKKPWGDKV